MKELSITQVDVRDLQSAVYNPRRWDESAVKELTESIKRFGLVDPILANSASNRKNIVIGGHFRLHIAKKLGYTEVPVVYLDIPDIEKEKELNLRLNKNTGDWDISLLQEFDPSLLFDVGFGEDELHEIWDEQLDIENDDFDVEKERENIKEPKTKLGDLIQLGKHRLLCGDSTERDDVQRLVGDEKPYMIYCDPPYNINFNYASGLGKRKKYGGSYSDSKSKEEFQLFLSRTIDNALTVSAEDTHVFYWCDETKIGLIQQLLENADLDVKRVCLWIKNNASPTPQVAFNKGYEPCVYATRGQPYLSNHARNFTEILNKEIATGNRTISDILDLFDIWLASRKAGQDYLHPTEKPPSLHEKPLRRCTKVGDVILDLFGGSGSTLIAAEQLNRKALLCEIDPIFCDVIIKRYETLTGNKAQILN